MTDPIHRPLRHILLGAAVVGTGAGFALALPPALTGVALITILLRICWLEDNIKSDLIDSDTLPPNHEQPLRDRAAFLGTSPDLGRPALVATALRGQVQALWAAVMGAFAILVASHLVATPAMALAAGVGLICLSFFSVDRLVVTLVHLDHGRALPDRTLVPTFPWVHSSRVRDD